MKELRVISAFLVTLSLIYSCVEETSIVVEQELPSQYNSKVMSLAKAVNAAVRENAGYRSLIKEEVSKLVDGDYDYLFSTAMDHKVTPSSELVTRSDCSSNITVKELLSYYYEPYNVKTRSSLDELEALIAEYPELQISVPVHAEDWDTESYVPVVAVVPEDCKYPGVKTLPAIDAEGNEIEIDAVNEPEEPVIVVGLNERLMEKPEIRIIQPVLPLPRITLSGKYDDGAVRLEYSFLNIREVKSLKIYRTDANSMLFNCIAMHSFLPLFNTYNDWEIEEGKEYSYYIEADCVFMSSGGDNIQKTLFSSNFTVKIDSSCPEPVLNLTSVNEYAKKNFITWDNPENSDYPTQIFKTTPNITNDLIATLDPTETYYYDEPVVKGEKWTYLVKKYNPNTGEVSPYAKTYVYNPYRNPSGKSKVVLRGISLDRSQIEGWFEGKPELYITTYGHSKSTDGTIKIDTLSFKPYSFERYSNGVAEDLSLVLADWSFFDDSCYYPVINIHVVEYDRGQSALNLDISAKIGVKLADEIGLEGKGKFSYRLSHDGQDCGVAYLRYYQNPCDTLLFPACNLKFIISE